MFILLLLDKGLAKGIKLKKSGEIESREERE